jgi:DNA repair exonuclease SbcCD ATPase subunit
VLQSVLTANREMLNSEFAGALGREHDLLEDEVTCWTCGEPTGPGAVEDTVDRLAELIEGDKERKAEREPEVAELTERIESARESRHRVEELEAEVSDLRDRRQARRESLDRKREALSETREQLAELDREISAEETDAETERSSLAEEIEATRVEIETTRRDIEQLEAACEELSKQVTRRDDLEASVTELTDEIQTLTERIERIETHLREEFNAAMDDLLAELAFERIDRVWLDGEFELVIAREVNGSVREDSLSHLAESEREMIGLVLGLAGFLAYDVEAVTPVLAIDSLSAFDTVRADRLLSYFADRTELLLAAVHPAMAEELSYPTMAIDHHATP